MTAALGGVEQALLLGGVAFEHALGLGEPRQASPERGLDLVAERARAGRKAKTTTAAAMTATRATISAAADAVDERLGGVGDALTDLGRQLRGDLERTADGVLRRGQLLRGDAT